MGSTRERIKAHAPPGARRLNGWRREVWADLRLRLLAEAGHFPSHRVRNACYRASGLVLPLTSSIHWRAEFYAPERIIVGEHVIIGDTVVPRRSIRPHHRRQRQRRQPRVDLHARARRQLPLVRRDRSPGVDRGPSLGLQPLRHPPGGDDRRRGRGRRGGDRHQGRRARTRSWAGTRPSPSARATRTSATSSATPSASCRSGVGGHQEPAGRRTTPRRDHSPLAKG